MNDPAFLALTAVSLLIGVVIATHPRVYRNILGDFWSSPNTTRGRRRI